MYIRAVVLIQPVVRSLSYNFRLGYKPQVHTVYFTACLSYMIVETYSIDTIVSWPDLVQKLRVHSSKFVMTIR